MYLSLTTCNRSTYLKTTIETLFDSKLPKGTNLVVADDSSTEEHAKKIINNLKSTDNITVHLIKRSPKIGCDPNMVETLKWCFVKGGEPFAITIDSDTQFHPLWYEKLMEAFGSIEDKSKIAGCTCYDSSRHPPKGSYNDLLNYKDHIGGFSALINRDLLFSLSPSSKQWDAKAWDWKYVALSKLMKYHFYGTKVSWVQHIGEQGMHSPPNLKHMDIGLNFMGDKDEKESVSGS